MGYIEENQKIRAEFNYLKGLEQADFVWEFMRRNEEYRKECDESGSVDYNRRSVDEDPVTGALPRELFPWYKDSIPLCFAEGYSHGSLPTWSFYHPTNICVWIDLIADKDEVKQCLPAIINEARAKEKASVEKKERRSMLNNWEKYLMAYDLKNRKPKLTIRRIADIVYNPDRNHMKEAGEHTSGCKLCRKTRNSIKRATELINGGYKEFMINDEAPSELLNEHRKGQVWNLVADKLRAAFGDNPDAFLKFLEESLKQHNQ